MKIALDAMGAEEGISTVIEACILATQENSDIQITLVGRKDEIENEIKKMNLHNVHFPIVDAPEVVNMEDSALAALKNKKNSSIAVGIDLVKEGKTEAFVSPGNTGAVMATSLVKLGKLKGVIRPCLAAIFPTFSGKRVVLVDVGANVDCKPNHLFQFAVLGSIYAFKALRVKNPRVALLNIGSEENKGNEVVVETFKMLKKSSLSFMGNVEGKDITSDRAEVVVCDGFVGNIILKFAEGFAATALSIMKKETRKSMWGLGQLLSNQWLKKLRATLDYAEYGGVPLLGINGICVVAHGASSSKAIKNAIMTGYRFSQTGINQNIENTLKEIQQRQEK
ncbi:phosphate acyltransferase PlsX [Candidatus Aerophobetes bacterium]|nr:phosphate acyltransferase PlsX [Candidatus Aerophobetes bacterium]